MITDCRSGYSTTRSDDKGSIAQRTQALTVRQTTEAREYSLRYGKGLMTRLALFAMGITEDPETGEIIKPMNSNELRAAEVVLRKILPDQVAVSETPVDEFADMDREGMKNLLSALVINNPELLESPELRDAVNKSQTVVKIDKSKADSFDADI